MLKIYDANFLPIDQTSLILIALKILTPGRSRRYYKTLMVTSVEKRVQ